jgi:hypothetical protein
MTEHTCLTVRRLALVLLAAVGCFTIMACDSSEPPAPGIDPGRAIAVDGRAVALGGSRAELTRLLGEPASTRDLGALGLRCEYPEQHLAVLLDGPGEDASVAAFYLDEGFEGRTADGLGIGSAVADVEASLGSAVRDPFTNQRWYPSTGVAFESSDEVVSRIHVFPPRAR